MSVPVRIVGLNGKTASFSEGGELLVAQGPYDLTEFRELGVDDTAYNFYKPDSSNRFIVTGFMAYGDKQVSSTQNATVVIYEAETEDTTTVKKAIFQFEIGQNQSVPFPNIRIITGVGSYINAKTDDDDVHMTILGHYLNG